MMFRMSMEQLEQYSDGNNVTEETGELVHRTHNSPITRSLDATNAGLAAGHAFVIDELQHLVPLESDLHREAPISIQADPDILAVWQHPPPLPVRCTSSNEREAHHWAGSDFCLVGVDGAGWEDYLDGKEIARCLRVAPGRYVCVEGQWRCSAGDEYASQYGLYYWVHVQVHLASGINWTYARNLKLLAEYRLHAAGPPDEALALISEGLVRERPGIALNQLVDKMATGAGTCAWRRAATTVLRMLASERLYADLRAAHLQDTARVRVYPDRVSAETCTLTPARPETGTITSFPETRAGLHEHETSFTPTTPAPSVDPRSRPALSIAGSAAYPVYPVYPHPLEVVEIDFTGLDEAEPARKGGVFIGRLWSTTATCPVRGVIAEVRSYERPGHRSIMRVLRQVLRRYGRLPRRIVVDNSPEFRSTQLEMFLEQYGCTLHMRTHHMRSHRAYRLSSTPRA